jgi:hypothetical protein
MAHGKKEQNCIFVKSIIDFLLNNVKNNEKLKITLDTSGFM